MKLKKNFSIQIVLIIVFFLIILFIYNNYYIKYNSLNLKPVNENTININQNTQTENIIENIEYISNNADGNVLKVSADSSVPQKNTPHIMFLTNVKGELYLDNKYTIKLNSDFAYFNTKSSETNFIDNVKIFRNNENISSDALYFVLNLDEQTKSKRKKIRENYIRISNNVTINRPNQILNADVIEIDLNTNDYKIFMNDKNNKVVVKTNFN